MKKTSTRILTVALSYCLLAASSFAGQETARGGMSGGGGRVLPGRAPDAPANGEQIEDTVKSSKAVALSYLSNLETRYLKGELSSEQKPLLERAFSGSQTLPSLARVTKVEVEDEEPCYDFEGNAVDGSIRSEKAGRICISSHSIANKVHRSEIIPQSAALMIHEFSELHGFSEEDAIALQAQALRDLLK